MERETYMRMALALAKQAADEGEVPVGAVVVHADKVISSGRNRREWGKNALWHAELEAIHGACAALGRWRLNECTLYVTLEPCPMCAGAIINARLSCVVFGVHDPKAGACGSVLNLFEEGFNHRPRVYAGVLEGECAALLSDFFSGLRKNQQDAVEKTPRI